jgi:hypothetical protein
MSRAAEALRKLVLAAAAAGERGDGRWTPVARCSLIDGRLTGELLPLQSTAAAGAGSASLSAGVPWHSLQRATRLSIPAGRSAELHLTAGSSGSLIAVLTHELAGRSFRSLRRPAGLGDDKQRLAEEVDHVAAARNEHALILPADKAPQRSWPVSRLAVLPNHAVPRSHSSQAVRGPSTSFTFSLQVPSERPGDRASIVLAAELVDLAKWSGRRSPWKKSSPPRSSVVQRC